MIDLHCHLLPGIDDGPSSMEDSLKLCRIAVSDGITHAIVTPHIHPGRWENTRQSIARDCHALEQALARNNIPLKLGFAGEIRLSDQLPRQVENYETPFYGEMGGFKIMLLEFPHGHIIPGSNKLVSWLLDRGIRPLIAHPERNRQVMRDIEMISPFVEAGCMLQLTGGSLLGLFGESVRRVALELLERNWVDVVASDGHNDTVRQPVLSGVHSFLGDNFGHETAARLLCSTPLDMISGQW